MPLREDTYCIEQISVPPKLPMILKQFCKSAIRTQPYDLLKWSSAYFHALACGDEPPAKLRLEYPPATSACGLTIGFLKVLFRQLSADYNKVVSLDLILERWDHLCLDRKDVNLIISIGKFRKRCQIKKFLSIAVGLLTRTLTETMLLVCELFTHEPDGGSAMIPIGLFMEIYGYLAGLRCDGAERGSTMNLCFCSESTISHVSETGPQEPHTPEPPAPEPPVPEPSAPESATSGTEENGPASVGSQATDRDAVEIDFDHALHKDVPSGSTLQSFDEESRESFRHEGQASFRSSLESAVSLKSKSSSERGSEPGSEPPAAPASDKPAEEPATSRSEASISNKSCAGQSSESTLPCSDGDVDQFFPDVPGIGRRLLAEEVANVAIWMSECARRQGGMIGPRNLRHINCPSLEGNCCT